MKRFMRRFAAVFAVLALSILSTSASLAQTTWGSFGATTAVAAPVISSLSSSAGTPGQSISIYGSGFTTSQCLLLNGSAISKLDISATAKSFTIPNVSLGTYTLQVAGTGCQFFGMTGSDSNKVSFTIKAAETTTLTFSTTPTITFSASPSTVTSGQASLLSWSTKNAHRCVLKVGSGETSAGVGGSEYVYPTQTTTYTLWCANDPGDGKDGLAAEKKVTVTVGSAARVAPTVALWSTPTSLAMGQGATLYWTTVNATRCVMHSGPVGSNGTSEESASITNGSKTIYPTQTTEYILWCQNDPGDGKDGPATEKRVTVTVKGVAQAPTLTITNPLDGHLWTLNDTQTFKWKTTGLASNLTGSIDLVSGNGTYYRVASITNTGSYEWSNLGMKGALGSLPAGDYSVKILINGYGDIVGPLTIAESGTAITSGSAPVITASVSPSTLTSNLQRAKITWSTSGAQSCKLIYGSTSKSIRTYGSKSVTPSVTTMYEIRCVSSAGVSASKYVTVSVVDPNFFGSGSTGGTSTFGSSGNSDIDPRTITSCVNLTADLGYRMTGTGVSTLQDFLQTKGYLNSEPTGYFGLMTQAAVSSFQSANGINPTGYVGPLTREKIRTISC